MPITKSPFILGGMPQEAVKTAKSSLGQKADKTSFITMVNQGSEAASQSRQPEPEGQSPHVISRLFANGLAMGESQHQKNETIMQSILQLPQQGGTGISLERNPSGTPIQLAGRGIPIDMKRDRIFAPRSIDISKVKPQEELTVGERVGRLAARFESGSQGVAAIGYDKMGGTSYGKYQIASKPGSMDQFIGFLKEEAPDLAKRLEESGSADTGSRDGKMPEVWQDIAKTQPDRFEKLQEQFIAERHYQPAMRGLQEAGFRVEEFSPAMKEVVWSSAVQHGPSAAVRIFTQAADRAGVPTNSKVDVGVERELIQNVYEVRGTQFGASTNEVRMAVSNRMDNERTMALAMLNANNKTNA